MDNTLGLNTPITCFVNELYPVFQPLKVRKDNEIFIVSNFNLDIFYLNETAELFCTKANGSHKFQDILQDIAQEYDVPFEELLDDMLILLRDLQWKKLISLSRSPTSSC